MGVFKYCLKIVLHVIFWFLAVFVVGRFIFEKSVLLYSVEQDKVNMLITSTEASEEQLKNIAEFKKLIGLRRVINETTILRHYEAEVQSRIETLYPSISNQDKLGRFENLTLDLYFHLYGNCCYKENDMTLAHDTVDKIISYETDDKAKDKYRIKILETVLTGWIGRGYYNRSQYSNNSIDSLFKNTILYGAGIGKTYWNRVRSKENHKMFLETAYLFTNHVNKKYPNDIEMLALKYKVQWYALRYNFKNWTFGRNMSEKQCALRSVYLLEYLAMDHVRDHDNLLIHLKSSLSEGQYKMFKFSPGLRHFRNECS